MNYVFLMGSLDSVIAKKDTSLALMVAAHRKGHSVFFLPNGGMVVKGKRLKFHVREVLPQFDEEQPFINKGAAVLSDDDVDVVFIRTDPPFNDQYLHNTWLLDLLPAHVPVINRPLGIRTVNEKIWASQFTSIVPRTMIASHKKELLAFLKEEKDVIAKPTNSYGGQSVFHLNANGPNAIVILETLTKNWSRDIIMQEYIPAAEHGDKRILLLDGEPLGVVLRVHSQDDHRNNFFAGGKPLAANINRRDEEIISILKPEFKRLGLYFVGIDIIGDYLIETNVTSPTCLQEMNRLYNCQLEDKVINFSEELAKQWTETRIS